MLEKLPPQFSQFLQDEGIDVSLIKLNDSRYVRVKPGTAVDIPEARPVKWIPDMYEIPQEIKINCNPLYKSGLLYGIDLSSAAVVQALDINNNDIKVLEVCCAPGAKLCYIADLMSSFGEDRKLYGLDINENRLNIARSLVKKYGHEKLVKLIQADGTTYQGEKDFDKILVDAECTHEGSVKHLQKFLNPSKKEIKNRKQSQKQLQKNHSNGFLSQQEKPNEWTEQDFLDRVLDPVKLNNLTNLQYGLLKNSATLLKPGGQLVYSTCSFSRRQNEDIVQRFLDEHPHFNLVDVFSREMPCKEGFIPKTVRFDPITSQCGGMFIAKFQ